MDSVLIVARVALAAVFLVAGVAKLMDMAGSRRALQTFRLAPAAVPLAAWALPLLEIAIALLLLLRPTAAAAGAIAAVLLLLFVAAITAALRRGEQPDCHCFGQLHSRPAGVETLVRNLVLTAVALLVLLAGPGPSLSAWASDSSSQSLALAAATLAALALGYACISLWRENRELKGSGPEREIPAIVEPGQRAPQFSVVEIASGSSLGSPELLGRARSVLVFTSATCGPCLTLLPELARWKEMLVGRLALHVIASGDEEENRRLAAEHDVGLLWDQGGAAATSFGILGTPSGVEVERDGTVMSAPVAGGPAIEALIRAALKRGPEPGIEVRQIAGA